MATINTNFSSLNAQRNLAGSASSLQTSMSRLSSGMRVNSAKDDAAGLAIAERMNAQTRGMNVAIRNANDGISLAQTAEGALGSVSNNLQRMRELAVQAANGTNTSADVASLANEYDLLDKENKRVVEGTQFNGQDVLRDAITSPSLLQFEFQVGANATANDKITVIPGNLTVTGWGPLGATPDAARLKIQDIDSAISSVTSLRSTWGATQNRFETVIANLRVNSENSATARGRIMDADYAQETANLSRAQVLQQAGTAIVAQANQSPQNVLALLR